MNRKNNWLAALVITASAPTLAFADASCPNPIPGFELCSNDPEVIYDTMDVQAENPNDTMLAYGSGLRISVRYGTHDGANVTCLHGTPLRAGVLEFYSCNYNEYLATGDEAVLLFLELDQHPDVEMIGQDRSLITSAWGSSVPVGSRIVGERRVGVYTCWARRDFDNTNFTGLNLANSAGSCSASLVKHLPAAP